MVILDLKSVMVRPLEAGTALKSDPALAAVPTVGFVSHVQTDLIAEARRAGVDQVILITQTETIPHERVLQSIEMFGKHVIPACRTETRAKPVPAGAR